MTSQEEVPYNCHPEVLWAQRTGKVYLTVALPDAKEVDVKYEPQGLFTFSAKGLQCESFHFTLHLYGTIVPAVSSVGFNLKNQRRWVMTSTIIKLYTSTSFYLNTGICCEEDINAGRLR